MTRIEDVLQIDVDHHIKDMINSSNLKLLFLNMKII